MLQLKHQPACLILSRQPLPTLDRSRFASAARVARGAYVLADLGGAPPKVILIGTGSEVSLCISAAEELAARASRARRQHAILGAVRAAGRGLSRASSAGGDCCTRRGGAGGSDRLGALCGTAGCRRRHAHVRRLRAAQRSAHQIRLHARPRGDDRQGTNHLITTWVIPHASPHSGPIISDSKNQIALARFTEEFGGRACGSNDVTRWHRLRGG